MHTVSGNWRVGLLLALVTTLLWGLLPIALKLLLPVMDAVTLTWYRFAVAAVLVGGYLALRRSLPDPRGLRGSARGLLLVAIFGLCANYLLYLLGLRLVSPAAAQIVIQLAPVFLLLGGVWLFAEPFRRRQWLGFALVVIGIVLFFNDRLATLLTGRSSEGLGIVLIVLSALTWAAYALAQKQLLVHFTPTAVMWMLYLAATLILLPGIHPGQVLRLDAQGLWLLIFCALNTLVAYGCFAASLKHWEASRVSAVIALAPLVTLAAVAALGWLSGTPALEPVNGLSLTGAGLVVTGSIGIVTPGATPTRPDDRGRQR